MKHILCPLLFAFLLTACATNSNSKKIHPDNQASIIKHNYGVELTDNQTPKVFTIKEFDFIADTPLTIGEAQEKYPDYYWNLNTYHLEIEYPKNKNTRQLLYFKGRDNSKKITYQLAIADSIELKKFKNKKIGIDKVIAIHIPSFDEVNYVCISTDSVTNIDKNYFSCNATFSIKTLEGRPLPKK